MSDRLYGGVRAGATSVSIPALLRDASTGLGATGKVAADLTGSYWRQGGLRVAITLADLGAVNSAYSSGGVKEVDSTNQKGLYRLDVPDAAFATGADWVVVTLQGAGLFEYHERFSLETRRSLRRNQAFSNYKFFMRQSANPGLGATGLTVTATRSLDGGAFAACANSVTEVSDGTYRINLAASDLDGEDVALRFTAATALDTNIKHVLEPA